MAIETTNENIKRNTNHKAYFFVNLFLDMNLLSSALKFEISDRKRGCNTKFRVNQVAFCNLGS